ncbi:MAG TPA: alpha/beta fold hydrolase [Steroidobacteraceae bacterium]|nr:alpha/beta fold hydrolase [Steroidobacteraceae bacterium]
MSPPLDPAAAIEGPAGRLEALIEEPADLPLRYAAVVCHPHPLFGGTLHNKVVHTLARALRSGGAATLRFNFRGVGASEGRHDEGVGETADTLAAVAWARERWPSAGLLLAGFSFGAAVAIRAAAAADPRWLISVAPAVDRVSLEGLVIPQCDWLIVQGSADEIVPPESVRSWVARTAPHARLRMLPGVGHFFHGRLHELQECIREEWPAL